MILKTTPPNIYHTKFIIRSNKPKENKKPSFGINPLQTVKQHKNLSLYQTNMTNALDKMIKLVQNFIPKKTDKVINVLDIGCCDGELLRNVRKNFPNAQTTGLELNQTMINNALLKDKKTGLDKNTSYIQGNAHFISDFKIKPDLVLMSKVLHEIYSYDNPLLNNERFSIKSVFLFLKNLYSKLTPGARVIIRDPAKPFQSNKLLRIADINTVKPSSGNDLNSLSTYELLDCFLSNFVPAKNNFFFKNNECIAPKWLISEFIRHRKFKSEPNDWKDELNEQYGTVLPNELRKMAKKIGYNVISIKNTGSLLINNKYTPSKQEFTLKNFTPARPITPKEFSANLIAILEKPL